MRRFTFITVAAFGVFFGTYLNDAHVASAGGMSGAEFGKVMRGNTLERISGFEKKNGKGEVRTYYFIDDKKLVYERDRNNGYAQPLQTTWTVSKSGRFCWFYRRIFSEICYHSFRLEGEKMIATSARSNTELTFTLVRGLRGHDDKKSSD
jgi:hypothetical protein